MKQEQPNIAYLNPIYYGSYNMRANTMINSTARSKPFSTFTGHAPEKAQVPNRF
jgi:hypothetical protein